MTDVPGSVGEVQGLREVCSGKMGEEPWRGHRNSGEAWARGHRLPVPVNVVGLQAMSLSGPCSSICNPRGLDKMASFTVFTEHLLCAVSWAGPQGQSRKRDRLPLWPPQLMPVGKTDIERVQR